MKNVLTDMIAFGGFILGLQNFFRQRISLTEAQAIIQRRMAERDTNFLRLVERGIFGYSKSPYRPLLELAGCELGDIRNMVRSKGLEATLRELRKAGVYITFEEFKGHKPIVRNGTVFHIQPRQFDNPFLSRHYQTTTGGSTGLGTRIHNDLDYLAALAPNLMIEQHILGALGAPVAIWFGTLPDPTGINAVLIRARYGEGTLKWFVPVYDDKPKISLKYRLANQCTLLAGRLFGEPLPWPEAVHLDQAAIVARWAAKMAAAYGACLILTHVSRALRVSMAALEEGLDLTHVIFAAGGEPPSPAKVRVIKRTGARWAPKFIAGDFGAVGLGCRQPMDENDLHFLKDGLALIQYPRRVPGSEITVQAFNFTSLLPSAPKLLLNVESDDYGIVETRACGCPFESYGYSEHLRKVLSFRKLTGEGVTLVGSEMLHILEEVLPARFGGSPLDYQLLEEEDQQGYTRLCLLVSPRIQNIDESQVIETVLEALKNSKLRALWKQAETLRIRRQEPILTARGKFMPLYRAQFSQRGEN